MVKIFKNSTAERVQPAPIYLRYMRIPFQINCQASAERVPFYVNFMLQKCLSNHTKFAPKLYMGLTPPLNNVQKNYAFGAGGHPLANDDYDDFE